MVVPPILRARSLGCVRGDDDDDDDRFGWLPGVALNKQLLRSVYLIEDGKHLWRENI